MQKKSTTSVKDLALFNETNKDLIALEHAIQNAHPNEYFDLLFKRVLPVIEELKETRMKLAASASRPASAGEEVEDTK